MRTRTFNEPLKPFTKKDYMVMKEEESTHNSQYLAALNHVTP
ncbi:MAG: hypothetical protein ACTHLE_25880 [Agriterribacter sp.]